MNRDPRLPVIERRLAGVSRILAVTGGKGGIGKTLVATGLALAWGRAGGRAGLLDLDLTGPCAHLVLGGDPPWPEEDYGLVPPLVAGIRFLSLACLSGGRPAPLRGVDLSNALIELLAVARWGELDCLVVDLPPGLGDALLDLVRLLPRAEYLAVATPSRVVVETVRRTLALLAGAGVPVLGVLENMRRGESPLVTGLAADAGLPYLGTLPFDEEVEAAVGDPERLVRTAPVAALCHLVAEGRLGSLR